MKLLLPSFPCPPFLSPHSSTYLTFNQYNRTGVSSSTVTATSFLSKTLLPNAKPTSMAAAPAYVDLPNGICMESTTTEHSYGQRERQSQRAYTRRPTPLEIDSRKTTETKSHSSLATSNTCTVSGLSIPGKIWMPTNQIRAIPTRAHVSRE